MSDDDPRLTLSVTPLSRCGAARVRVRVAGDGGGRDRRAGLTGGFSGTDNRRARRRQWV